MVKSTKNKLIFGGLIILLIVVIVGFSSCSCNRESYEDAVRLGQDALSNGNYEDAIYHLKRASKLSPEDYTILVNLGMAYFEAEEYASAANAFETAVLVNPTEEALEALAVTRQKQKLYEQAIEAYNRALTEYGRKSYLLAGIAACQAGQGNVKHAFAILKEALGDNPRDPIALYNMAKLTADNNEIVQAANYFAFFFEVVDPSIHGEQIEKARARFATLIEKFPEENKVAANQCYSNAVNYYRQKNLEAAFVETRKATTLNPAEPNYVALLIAISKQVNRTENVERLTNRIKYGFPDFAEKFNIK